MRAEDHATQGQRVALALPREKGTYTARTYGRDGAEVTMKLTVE